MILEADILKGKHFPLESESRLRATMVSLFVYLFGFELLFDIYQNIHEGYYAMVNIEIIMILVFSASYLLFPRYINIKDMAKFMIVSFDIFLTVSLSIPHDNAAFTLFLFAVYPMAIFLVLGKDEGKFWAVLPLIGLLVLWVAVYFDVVNFLYNKTLFVQLIFAYVAVSYGMYIIEGERSMYEAKLNLLTENNKLLFKEVHHRTKNNMQVMMGLLETQSFKISDPKYKKMFHAHVDRIKSMSYIHENLYSGDSYESVDMHKYLNEILDNLQKITQHTIVADIDYVRLGIKGSINIGLIVNEAVNNAIEHAYGGGVEEIDVTLKCHQLECILTIKDHGIGFNTEKEFQSLGMTLIEDLSASLPQGRVKIDIDNGTRIQVYFNITQEI